MAATSNNLFEEELVRKALECMRGVSEAQMKEFHEAVTKLTDLATKAGN